MYRRFIQLLQFSCSALGLGVVLCACPAGFAPTGAINANRDTSSVTASEEVKEADGNAPIPVSGVTDGAPSFNATPANDPAGGGSVALPIISEGPSAGNFNPVIADNSGGGIAAQPDGSVIGRLPFIPAGRRVWAGFQLNQEIAEGETLTVAVPPNATSLDLRVLAEYRLANPLIPWKPYPSGTQVRLIYIPKSGGFGQVKHYDTVVVETAPDTLAPNIIVDDLPLPGEGKLIAFTYEAFQQNEELGDYVMQHTGDFQEGTLAAFPNVFKLTSFLDDFFTHKLFTVEIKTGLSIHK